MNKGGKFDIPANDSATLLWHLSLLERTFLLRNIPVSECQYSLMLEQPGRVSFNRHNIFQCAKGSIFVESWATWLRILMSVTYLTTTGFAKNLQVLMLIPINGLLGVSTFFYSFFIFFSNSSFRGWLQGQSS